MQVKCPRCGHSFDAGEETLVDCPSCALLIDTRTVNASNVSGSSPVAPKSQEAEHRKKMPSAEVRRPTKMAPDKQPPGSKVSRNISAIVAALFIPGGGHFRIGRPARGAIYFLGFILAGVIVFLSVPFQEQLPPFMRGYSDSMANLYRTLSFLVSHKVIYTVIALTVAQAASVLDLVILLIIGDTPSRHPENRR